MDMVCLIFIENGIPVKVEKKKEGNSYLVEFSTIDEIMKCIELIPDHQGFIINKNCIEIYNDYREL